MPAVIMYQVPRTPPRYRTVCEPPSPLARYSRVLPRPLPSLLAWKAACMAFSAIEGSHPVSSSCKGNPNTLTVPPRARKFMFTPPDHPESKATLSTPPNVTSDQDPPKGSSKRKLDEASFRLPSETDPFLQYVLDASRNCKRSRVNRDKESRRFLNTGSRGQ